MGLLLIMFLSINSFAIISDGEDRTMMSVPSPTTFSCSGLKPGQTDRMDDEQGDPLFQVPQVNDQEQSPTELV